MIDARLTALLPALLLTAACASDGASKSSAAMEQPELSMEEMMGLMMQYATPGEQHAELARAAGHWTVEGVFYMEPGSEPTPMVATADIEVLLDGRMVQETFRSEFEGMPFEGRLLQGYDNLKGEYWTLWFDNMSTWGSPSTGNYNERGELVLEGMMHDAKTPGGRRVRTVVRDIDPDHTSMKMYDVGADGSATVTMELNYTRAR